MKGIHSWKYLNDAETKDMNPRLIWTGVSSSRLCVSACEWNMILFLGLGWMWKETVDAHLMFPGYMDRLRKKRHLQYGSDGFVWFGQCGLSEAATQIPGCFPFDRFSK